MKTFVLTVAVWLFFSVNAAQELSMMENCIDDRFDKCIKKTATKVIEVYFPREILNSPFKEAWNLAAPCAQKKLERLQPKYNQLTSNHTRAICVYTSEDIKLYDILNSAVRTGGPSYSTPVFEFHALYFWLTSALQILKGPCQTTYRRSTLDFNGNKGDVMRFGYFASSSKRCDMTHFGSKTCFHIKTCLGAYIEDYSDVKGEEEVLIPPYEKFKIVEVATKFYGGLSCNKIFVLKNVGARTRLNCKAANHNQQIRANPLLILAFLALGWFANESVFNEKMRN